VKIRALRCIAALVGLFMASVSASASASELCEHPRQMDGFRTCANVEQALAEGALVHYSPDPDSEMAAYLGEFHKAFPQIQTNFLRLQTGALYARLTAERQAKAYMPDTLILTEIGFALDFQKRGGYAPYRSPEMAAFAPHQKSVPEGYYTWDNQIVAGIAYNPNLVKADEAPKSWKDLLDPRWTNGINVKLSTSGLQHLVWYLMRQMYGAEYWQRFAALQPRGFDSYVQQFDRMVSGQDQVIATAQYSGYLVFRAKGAPITFVRPAEGLVVTPGVIGVVDHAPHPEAARLFLDWYIGVPGQTVMTRVVQNYSARTDVPPPPGGDPIGSFKLMAPDDWEAFLKTHAQFVREWDRMTGIR
jgi:iron(III) transport system substrate-binding protein